MHEWRITKYDPAHRDSSGAFLRSEWTSFSDVGRQVTLEEYVRIETAYIEIAMAFLSEAQIDSMHVEGLEQPGTLQPVAFSERDCLSGEDLRSAFRSVLRELAWCRFTHPTGAFVHFGYDYYMYVGLPSDCPGARAMAIARGLFVEPFVSPHSGSAKRDSDLSA